MCHPTNTNSWLWQRGQCRLSVLIGCGRRLGPRMGPRNGSFVAKILRSVDANKHTRDKGHSSRNPTKVGANRLFDTDEGLSGTPSSQPGSQDIQNRNEGDSGDSLLPFICKQTDNPLELRVDIYGSTAMLAIVPNPLFKLEWSVLSLTML